jgi:hypothetical protein
MRDVRVRVEFRGLLWNLLRRSDMHWCDVNGDPTDRVSRCCRGDEGRPLEAGVQKRASNQAVPLWPKRPWW